MEYLNKKRQINSHIESSRLLDVRNEQALNEKQKHNGHNKGK
jgi:hypothetical protein